MTNINMANMIVTKDLVLDYLIKNVDGGKMREVVFNKNVLVMNFDYFEALIKMNHGTCESELDLGLDIEAIKLCYELITRIDRGRINGYVNVDGDVDVNINYQIEIMIVNICFKLQCHYWEIIMRLLEVCDALQCKNRKFLEILLSYFINRLDSEDSSCIDSICATLKDNSKVGWNISKHITWRMSYKINPTIYSNVSDVTDLNLGPEDTKLMLVVYPEKIWISKYEHALINNAGVRSKNIVSYSNWGELYVFDNVGKILRIQTTQKNHVIYSATMNFTVSKIKNSNETSYITMNPLLLQDTYAKSKIFYCEPSQHHAISNSSSILVDYNIKQPEYSQGYVLTSSTPETEKCVVVINMVYRGKEDELFFV